MVLDEQRGKAEFALLPVAKKLINVNPNIISWIGLILAFVSGLVLYFSYDVSWDIDIFTGVTIHYNRSYLLILGAVLVLVSGYFDALDGKIAKLAGKASKKGDYLDHVFDRYADVFMIGGVAVSGWCNPYLGILALVGVLLTSYMGTQAQAVGAPRLYAGLLGRADRVVLSTLFPIIQFIMIFAGYPTIDIGDYTISWLEIMIIYFAVVGNLTAIQRGVITWRNMSKEDSQ
ncbi:MAG: CDP-alcohol phosphatidyltransferase family protein [Candidatus Methanoplasma sp.]|jgi:archaetidylinositol phosphate synthase|nr:CDP-alcohol phosphatidyltransferase family protein [Candidatus Methanoplasma sp.]